MTDYKYCPRCATLLVEKFVFGANHQTCPNCGFVVFLDPKVVAVVVVEHGGQILLGRRNIEPAKDKWSLPGGYINRGEGVEAAAYREVLEETNLEVELQGLLGVYSYGEGPIIIAYRAQVSGDLAAMTAQEEEVSQLAFFDPDKLPELAFGSEDAIMADWHKAVARI